MKINQLILILFLFLIACRDNSNRDKSTKTEIAQKPLKEFTLHLFIFDDNNEGAASFRLNGLSLLNDTLYYLPPEKGLSIVFPVADSIHFRRTEEIAEKIQIKDFSLYNSLHLLADKLKETKALDENFQQYQCGVGKSDFTIQVIYNDNTFKRFTIMEPRDCKEPDELLKSLMVISSYLRSK